MLYLLCCFKIIYSFVKELESLSISGRIKEALAVC